MPASAKHYSMHWGFKKNLSAMKKKKVKQWEVSDRVGEEEVESKFRKAFSEHETWRN